MTTQQHITLELGYTLSKDGNLRKETPIEPLSFVEYCGRIVDNVTFQRFIISLIVLNSILMGIGTYSLVTDHPRVDNAFEFLDRTFLILFTVELAIQFVVHGVCGLFQNGWLTFDFWVIGLSWVFSGASVIRGFRIVRAARLVTKISELKNLVRALVDVIPKMFAIFMLMLLVFYIFGVMFTQLFHSAYDDGVTEIDYFSSLHLTFFTLFQLMTLENWSTITRDLMAVYWWAWIPMICFVLVSSFIVINLVIAVICDAVASTQKIGREQSLRRMESGVDSIGHQQHCHDSSEKMARLETKLDELTCLVQQLLLKETKR